jgi:mRNA interferase RelE/StbE
LKVEFRESFLKDLRIINNAKLLARVRKAIENVEESDAPHQIHNFKKLKGGDSYFRIRIGQYRVGLKMESDDYLYSLSIQQKRNLSFLSLM